MLSFLVNVTLVFQRSYSDWLTLNSDVQIAFNFWLAAAATAAVVAADRFPRKTRQTDRQTDRQVDRQIDIQIDRQIKRQKASYLHHTWDSQNQHASTKTSNKQWFTPLSLENRILIRNTCDDSFDCCKLQRWNERPFTLTF